MTKEPSIKKNFIMNFILQLSALIFPLITFPYVSRILLAEGNGRIAFVNSVVSYFTMFALLGIPAYGVRQVAKVRENKRLLSKTVQEIFYLNTILTVIVLIVYLISIQVIPRFQEESSLFYLHIGTFLLNLLGMEWLYKGLEQYQYIAKRSLVFKIISIVLMFLLVREKSDVMTYGAITIFAAAGSSLLNFINLRKVITFYKDERLNIKQHVKATLGFFVLTISISVYTNLDSVMLGWMQNNEAVGYYSAAVKIKSILVGLVTSLGAVLLPRLAFYHERGDEKEFSRLCQKSLDFIWIASFPMSAFFILYATESIRFLSGAAYDPAVLPMQVVMPTLLFIGLTNLMGWQILVPTNREHIVVKSVTAGAIVNLVANALLIPPFGPTGAAIGTLIAEFIVLAYQWWQLKGFMAYVVDIKEVVKTAFASVLCSVVILFVPKLSSLFWTLVVHGILYFGLYGIILILIKEKHINPFVLKLRRKFKW